MSIKKKKNEKGNVNQENKEDKKNKENQMIKSEYIKQQVHQIVGTSNTICQ